jgi:elongation factor 1 alpha-like protein
METLTVEETPKVKSKNLNVVDEFENSGMKRMANFVVIGRFNSTSCMRRTEYNLQDTLTTARAH